MANTRNGNTVFIDSASTTIGVKNIKVKAVVVTATAASAVIVLKDVTTGATKLDLRVATSGLSTPFYFYDAPVVFPNGINPTTVTNGTATLIIEEGRS